MTIKSPKLEKDALYRMYWIERKSLRVICKEIGCTYGTIYKYMKKLGVKVKIKSPKLERDALYRMYWIEGKNMRVIGDEIGCGRSTVRRRMKKFGIRIREMTEAKRNISDETRRRMTEANRNPSEETRRKMAEAHKGMHNSEETRRKISEGNRGKYCSEETRRKIAVAQAGEKGHNWKGGVSFNPYCQRFTPKLKEKIRENFGRACFLCGKTEEANGKRLDVHHVNGDKMQGCNGKEWLLVPLCRSCHSKIQHDKNKKLNDKILDKLNVDECKVQPRHSLQ